MPSQPKPAPPPKKLVVHNALPQLNPVKQPESNIFFIGNLPYDLTDL
jgi:hypothetical protein